MTLFHSCTGGGSSEEKESRTVNASEAYDIGREVSDLTGAKLVSQLSKAIAEQGPPYAIEFCNLAASGIVDSINQANDCTVQRLTNRRRNPANKIETSQDTLAWNFFRSSKAGVQTPDTVLLTNGSSPVYYRPIFIPSELCLQCHGSRSKDIALSTLEKIDSLYPADAAVNYMVGDLRGMWKISFLSKEE
jgi:hypothetical protein